VTVSAHDIAGEIRARVGEDVGVVKLHKLLYYAQGWYLAWTGEQLFDEKIEAWANGPVVAGFWADERHGRPRPAARPVEGRELAIVDYVVEEYGRFTGKALIRQTHLEDPWLDVSESDDDGAAGPSPEITREALSAWFTQHEDHQRHLAELDRLQQDHRTPFDDFEHTQDFAAAISRAVS